MCSETARSSVDSYSAISRIEGVTKTFGLDVFSTNHSYRIPLDPHLRPRAHKSHNKSLQILVDHRYISSSEIDLGHEADNQF